MSSMRLGKRALSEEEYRWQRERGRGTNAAAFRLGSKITGITPSRMPGTFTPPPPSTPVARLTTAKLEIALRKAEAATVAQYLAAELATPPARKAALKVLAARAKDLKDEGLTKKVAAALAAT